MALRLLVVAILGLLVPSCIAKNILYTNEFLYSGDSLQEGNYRLTMESNCNLVLYNNQAVIWSAMTQPSGSDCIVRLLSTGRLVMYNSRGSGIWSNGVNGPWGKYVLVLQPDGNVIIYGPSIWATNTSTGTLGVVITGDHEAAARVIVNRKIAMVTANN